MHKFGRWRIPDISLNTIGYLFFYFQTRDCGKQIDEGDFYQVLREKEEDESLTDATERLLRAAREYICKETASVWKNAELSVLGPKDQIVFVSGTQTNRFVVTLDERDKVKVYCREKSWNAIRNDVNKEEQGAFSWRSLLAKVNKKRKQPAGVNEQVIRTNINHQLMNNHQYNNVNGYSNRRQVQCMEDMADAGEEYYSADEYKIVPQRSQSLKTTPTSQKVTSYMNGWKTSLMKNSTVSSVFSILIGLFHMIRLVVLAYWQIVKCVLKGASHR